MEGRRLGWGCPVALDTRRPEAPTRAHRDFRTEERGDFRRKESCQSLNQVSSRLVSRQAALSVRRERFFGNDDLAVWASDH